MPTLFQVIRPKSLSNSDYEAFEYLINWIGRDGSYYQFMFYDAELDLNVSNEVINTQDVSNIQSLVSKVGQGIALHADDLSLNDLKIIGQLFENKYVNRIFKDGTTERYAPSANSFKYRLMDGRYEVDFKLVLADIKAWR